MRILLLTLLCSGISFAQQNQGSGLSGQLVSAHNQIRSGVGVAPLRWSNELGELAQEWADSLIHSGAFRPRGDHRFGENLFEITNRAATPYEVVSAWAAEAKNYDYKSNTCSARCGHYKQVVWRGTQLVGCGVARDSRREIWVCNYDPLGNLNGERPY